MRRKRKVYYMVEVEDTTFNFMGVHDMDFRLFKTKKQAFRFAGKYIDGDKKVTVSKTFFKHGVRMRQDFIWRPENE